MTKKAIMEMFKEAGAKIEIHKNTKRVISFYNIDNTAETITKVRDWLEKNKVWHIKNGPTFHQYGMANGIMINFFGE